MDDCDACKEIDRRIADWQDKLQRFLFIYADRGLSYEYPAGFFPIYDWLGMSRQAYDRHIAGK